MDIGWVVFHDASLWLIITVFVKGILPSPVLNRKATLTKVIDLPTHPESCHSTALGVLKLSLTVEESFFETSRSFSTYYSATELTGMLEQEQQDSVGTKSHRGGHVGSTSGPLQLPSNSPTVKPHLRENSPFHLVSNGAGLDVPTSKRGAFDLLENPKL